MIGIFVWLSTILFGFLGFIWSRSNWANCLIKFCLYGLVVLGIVILYQQNGFSGIQLK